MPANKKKFSLRQAFHAAIFALGLGCATTGMVNTMEGFTAATAQDFDTARGCDANVANHKPCTHEQVTSLRNIRTSFQKDAMGFTWLLGGGFLLAAGVESEAKRKRRNPAPER